MKNIPLIIALFLILGGLASCQVKCSDPSFNLTFSDLDSNDHTLVRLSAYEKYSNFSKLAQTQIGGPTRHLKDTLHLSKNYWSGYGTFYLDYNYDYLVEIFPSGTTYKVTGMTAIPGKSYETDHSCRNSATWYLNGKQNRSEHYLGSGDVYITLQK